VKDEILKFIKYEKIVSKREHPLLTKDKRANLSEDVKKLILCIHIFD